MHKSRKLILKVYSDANYSVRRFFVDDFMMRQIKTFSPGDKLLDMGGVKQGKRGSFNIDGYGLEIKYANIDAARNPDFLCSITCLPVEDNFFDGIVLSEVIEHVYEAGNVLQEAFRVLKPGGKLLICAPFIYNIHSDPGDFARYTDQWFKITLTKLGFNDIIIERQGGIYSVLAHIFKQLKSFDLPRNRFCRICRKLYASFLFHFFLRKAENKEIGVFTQNGSIISNLYTTGFGVVCQKPRKG